MKSMIYEENLVYDDRTSLSDYYESDESGASNDDDSDKSEASCKWKKPKKPKKTILDEEDKKFFTCLPTCYAMFFAFDSKDFVESYCPFAKHNKCWQERILWNQLDWYECRSFKADELRQHVSQNHSKSWCGMGVKLFLHELYPSPLSADKESTANQNKRGIKEKRESKH